ncbi:UV excision repair protein rad23 [Malassezia cuniculi]|uniref:UV excision repair protein rad23 n=1 Tax=Malassezia cuniculi TaxID=948313 RepID=A0AAF0F1B0_9BASI|nr:UV excision repair protein rad23 [Malassezia cuniculi]
MKLLFKSLAGGNFHLDVETTDTVLQVKQKIQEEKGHAAELQKLIYAGKILTDDKTLGDYEIKEKDFLVVMVSKPKAKPAPAKEEPKQEAKETPKEETSAGASSSAPPATPAPSRTTAPETPAAPVKAAVPAETPGTPAPTNSSFLAGSELETAINNIMELGYSREEVQQAMRRSFNNPDRAVEYLMNGLPEETPASAPAPAAAAAAEAPAAGGAAAAPAPRAGNLFEQAAAQAASGNHGAAGSAGGDIDMLPGEDDGHGRQVIDLGNPQVLAQLRTLVEQNPAALQPLIQALVQSNPQLAELLSSDPDGFMRLLAGNADMGDDESFEMPTLQQLSERDRTNVEQIIAMGIPESKAIEVYLMCGNNVEMAVQYYFDNPGDFED